MYTHVKKYIGSHLTFSTFTHLPEESLETEIGFLQFQIVFLSSFVSPPFFEFYIFNLNTPTVMNKVFAFYWHKIVSALEVIILNTERF